VNVCDDQTVLLVQLQVPVVHDLFLLVQQVRHEFARWHPRSTRAHQALRIWTEHVSDDGQVFRGHRIVVVELL